MIEKKDECEEFLKDFEKKFFSKISSKFFLNPKKSSKFKKNGNSRERDVWRIFLLKSLGFQESLMLIPPLVGEISMELKSSQNEENFF